MDETTGSDETTGARCRTCGRVEVAGVPIIAANIGEQSDEWVLVQREGAALLADVMRQAGPALDAMIEDALNGDER